MTQLSTGDFGWTSAFSAHCWPKWQTISETGKRDTEDLTSSVKMRLLKTNIKA